MPKFNTIDEYIDAQPEPQAKLLEDLRKAIFSAVPDAEETFNYGVPAFSLVKAGKRDQQIMIGAFKKHVGIYPHPTAILKFKKELAKFKQGKGSIQFLLNETIPTRLIVKMVKYRRELLISELNRK